MAIWLPQLTQSVYKTTFTSSSISISFRNQKIYIQMIWVAGIKVNLSTKKCAFDYVASLLSQEKM